MNYPFLQRHFSGQFRPAGHHIFGLCAAWNHATNPGMMMTEREHAKARLYAKAIKARMARLGLTYGLDWCELSNGIMWPLSRNRKFA